MKRNAGRSHCFKSYFMTKPIFVVSRQKLSVISGSGEVLNLYAQRRGWRRRPAHIFFKCPRRVYTRITPTELDLNGGVPRGFFFLFYFILFYEPVTAEKPKKKNKIINVDGVEILGDGGCGTRHDLYAPRAAGREESVRWRQNARFMTLCEEDGGVCVQSRA